ncbi:hypothetical protein O181_039419 [Austropuccinia psidii MF-1]|uniref:Uncharacterized protein n=1 Tax=Austropuccinia psidii MF-1 TaxID=1389203 RepID=A0A9Q3HEJ3_9BASI|nr:hypothetical protein [Austropuccinia psidii MF-1]
MDNKMFNLALHWEEFEAGFQKIFLKEIPLKRSYYNHQRMESQQVVQTPGEKRSQDKRESSHYPSHIKTETDRAYSDSFRITRSKPARLPGGFTPFKIQKISDQE